MTTKGFETVQWSYDFIQSFYLNNNETVSDTEKIYLHYLSPFADKYFSPLNSFLLFAGADVEQLMKKDVWLLRDGLIPLSFFFKDAPEDLMKGGRKFLIHRDFWFLVPPSWQKNVQFYDMVPEKRFNKNILPERIFLTGIANDTLADSEEFLQSVRELGQMFTKEQLKKIQVQAYFPNKRADLWGRWQDENIFKYAKYVFEHLKLDIEFPEWEMIKNDMNYSNTLYWEINSGAIIKDTAVQQMFFSRGAGTFEKSDENNAFKLIKTHKLSLYHSVAIYELDYSKCPAFEDPMDDELMPYFRKVIEKGTSPRILSAGWEKWYGAYVKKHYKNRKIN